MDRRKCGDSQHDDDSDSSGCSKPGALAAIAPPLGTRALNLGCSAIMSLFRKNVDRRVWLDEFHDVYRQSMPRVEFVAGFFSDKTPSNSDLITVEDCRQTLSRLLQRLKAMAKPRDDHLYKLRADFHGLLYGCMRFCEWRIKQSAEPSRARHANMTAFMVVAVEHWKSLRLLLGTTNQERQ
jgi:hypothetical protein